MAAEICLGADAMANQRTSSWRSSGLRTSEIDLSAGEGHNLVAEGVLWKRGQFRHNWKQRYFRLTTEGLHYFEVGTRPKGQISFSLANGAGRVPITVQP